MRSTLDFRKCKVDTGGYGYQGYKDDAGNKYILKWGDSPGARHAYTLARHMKVLAPRILKVQNEDNDYRPAHLVRYFDKTVTAMYYIERLMARYDRPEDHISRQLVKSAVNMLAFDMLHMDSDRHDENYLVRDDTFIAIDLDGAFMQYHNYQIGKYNLSRVTSHSNVAYWLFGGDNKFLIPYRSLRLNPRDYITASEARRVINRIATAPEAAMVRGALAAAPWRAEQAGLIAQRVAAQKTLAVTQMSQWLSL